MNYNIFKRFVYKHTEKPKCYVHVDKPKTLQDYRQIQYNKWCKQKGVFNGSYLPSSPDKLLKKGWVESTSEKNRSLNRNFRLKSTGQIVRYDAQNDKPRHYHWYNEEANSMPKKRKKENYYRDRYGKTCAKSSDESHLAPYDRDFIKK